MNILLIAYYFPPDSSSGAFRPLLFARHLHEFGEQVTILTAREEDYLPDQPKDPKLLAELAANIDIFRAGVFRPVESLIALRNRLAHIFFPRPEIVQSLPTQGSGVNRSRSSWIQRLKDFLTDCLSTPDKHIGWLPSAVNLGRTIINQRQIDVMYATGGPWTSFLIGAILKTWTKRPLIMDFRDPWVANPYLLRKGRLLRAFEAVLERYVLKFADAIITNTEELREDFLRRHAWLNQVHIIAIPNGFEDYLDVQPGEEDHKLTLTHAGALYFSRNPRPLLQAVVNVIEQRTIPKAELRLVLLGELVIRDPVLEELLQHPIIREVVEILPRLPYHDAVTYQTNSDILFLIQPDFPLQVPRKLYEYMAFRKPILGITNLQGATARIIQENKLGMVVENHPAAIEHALKTLYEQWQRGFPEYNVPGTCDRFLNRNLTQALLQVLSSTC